MIRDVKGFVLSYSGGGWMLRLVFIFIVGLLVVGGVNFSLKANEDKLEVENEEIEVIENKTCPVCGGKIIEEMEIQCKHENKICFVCSKKCAERFEEEPQKYLDILEKLEKKSDVEVEKSQERQDRRDSHK